ncbi:MAG: hypothetical protein KC586_27270, partial [Myxococcales bacterium]|nr:hypothetical protein [Myxococcales bacterium]
MVVPGSYLVERGVRGVEVPAGACVTRARDAFGDFVGAQAQARARAGALENERAFAKRPRELKQPPALMRALRGHGAFDLHRR